MVRGGVGGAAAPEPAPVMGVAVGTGVAAASPAPTGADVGDGADSVWPRGGGVMRLQAAKLNTAMPASSIMDRILVGFIMAPGQ